MTFSGNTYPLGLSNHKVQVCSRACLLCLKPSLIGLEMFITNAQSNVNTLYSALILFIDVTAQVTAIQDPCNAQSAV
jgi:hypothetical protein